MTWPLMTDSGLRMMLGSSGFMFAFAPPESVIQRPGPSYGADTTFAGFTVRDSASGAGIVALNAQGDQIKTTLLRRTYSACKSAAPEPQDTRPSSRTICLWITTLPAAPAATASTADFALAYVKIDGNKFTGHLNGSISLYGSAANPQHNVEISGNTIDHDGPIGLATIKDVAITGNTITGNGSLNPLLPETRSGLEEEWGRGGVQGTLTSKTI